jgi:3,5-epimerase/4-reductase
MNKSILIFGKGFIGARLQEGLSCQSTQKRIESLSDAEGEIDKYAPSVVINCIGHVGRSVDECELDKDKALHSNSLVPLILAEAAYRRNIRFVHLSTGCIFHYDYEKDEPITEERKPDFFELFYSRTKIFAEASLAALNERFPVLILRPRIPLDDRPHPLNLLNKLLAYRRVIGLPNSVTYIPDFIRSLKHLVDIGARGIYHTVNEGGLKYDDLMKVYKKYRPDFSYQAVDFKKLGLVRTNLILSAKKLKDSGFKVRNINEVLEECVQNYLKF